jgi:hypothetical protein
MNPLKLDRANRRFFEALVDLNATSIDNKEEWLAKYRLVKHIKQTEGKAVVQGWRCFYELNAVKGLPMSMAERFF